MSVSLIIGGAASGKSEYAEGLAEALYESLGGKGSATLWYIATMDCPDEESKARVEKHVLRRAGKGYETVECPTGTALGRLVKTLEQRGAKVQVPGQVQTPTQDPTPTQATGPTVLLLDCLGNLVANELFGNEEDTMSPDELADTVLNLSKQADHTVLVSNEVFSGGKDYAGDTDRYLRALADLHLALAEQADSVAEVVVGIPTYVKGEAPA